MKTIITIIAALVLSNSARIAAAQIADKQEGLPPKERVIACVRRTGLDEWFQIKCYKMVRLPSLELPFSTPANHARMALLVELTSGRISWKKPTGGINDPYVREFFIYLDVHARFLLMVTSKVLSPRADQIDAPPIRPLRGIGDEEFGPPPLTDPRFTFVQVLEQLRQHRSRDLKKATEFDAYYLMYSKMWEPLHPVWIVRTRGEPPEPLSTPIISGDAHWDPDSVVATVHRDCIDATDGKIILLESRSDSL